MGSVVKLDDYRHKSKERLFWERRLIEAKRGLAEAEAKPSPFPIDLMIRRKILADIELILKDLD